MSKKDDKHLKLIEECKWLTRSADSLKIYQTKITKLANSLQRDILQENVRDLFTQEELESIGNAFIALSNFKNTVTHAKEYRAREERRHKALQDKLNKQALDLVRKKYSLSGGDTIGKLRFVLAEAKVDDGFKYDYTIDDIVQRVSDEKLNQKVFPEWVENRYTDAIRSLAGKIVGWYDTELDVAKMESLFDRVTVAMQSVDRLEKKLLDQLAWHVAKHTSEKLSDTDKKSLGI